MSIIAAILLCIAVTFHIIALGYLYRFIRCRVWGDERYPSLGQFQVSMKEFVGLKNSQIAAPQPAMPGSDVPSFPPHWAPSTFSHQGADPNLKMPHVFKVRIVDGKHPEDEKEFVGMADSPEQAVEFALSMVSDCEVPLVFSVERISVLDI
ncbi:MAG: DUF4013 domain-containing protein [Acidobacteriia bacterium]|nr:DUF4013 domain-containing protein [Terriglobia bacterium]